MLGEIDEWENVQKKKKRKNETKNINSDRINRIIPNF